MYGVHRPIIHGPWTVDHGSCALASRFCDPPRKGLLIARLISHILFAFPFFDLPSAQITCKCVPEFLHDHLPSMAARQGVVGRTPDISSSNRGPIVNLVAWIAMVTMCLSVFTVLVSKYLMLRKLTWSDVSPPIRRVRSGRRLQPSRKIDVFLTQPCPLAQNFNSSGKHNG